MCTKTVDPQCVPALALANRLPSNIFLPLSTLFVCLFVFIVLLLVSFQRELSYFTWATERSKISACISQSVPSTRPIHNDQRNRKNTSRQHYASFGLTVDAEVYNQTSVGLLLQPSREVPFEPWRRLYSRSVNVGFICANLVKSGQLRQSVFVRFVDCELVGQQ